MHEISNYILWTWTQTLMVGDLQSNVIQLVEEWARRRGLQVCVERLLAEPNSPSLLLPLAPSPVSPLWQTFGLNTSFWATNLCQYRGTMQNSFNWRMSVQVEILFSLLTRECSLKLSIYLNLPETELLVLITDLCKPNVNLLGVLLNIDLLSSHQPVMISVRWWSRCITEIFG